MIVFSYFYNIMQLELFPNFPRLSASDLPTIHDWTKDWETFDYPSDTPESMGQSSQQSEIITYLHALFGAIMANQTLYYFVSSDIFMYFSKQAFVENKKGIFELETVKKVRAPDLLLVQGAKKGARKSFILESEHQKAHAAERSLYFVVIEIMSDSNYADKDDLKNMLRFYNEAKIQELIIVHTKPTITLEVYWRLGDSLQRILFAEQYSIQSLRVHFEVELAKSPTESDKLWVINSKTGERFENYATERQIRKDAMAQFKAMKVQAEKERIAREEAEIRATQAEEKATQAEEKATQAEEKATQAEEKATQAEEKATQERLARLNAEAQNKEEMLALQEREEELRKALFELEEIKNLLKVQEQYKADDIF